MDQLCDSITESVSLRTPVKRPTRQTPRPQSPMDIGENDVCLGKRVSRTPQRSARLNLDESFRRSVLKSQHNSENVRNSPRKTGRTSYVHKLFSEDEASEQSSESDESFEESPKQKNGAKPVQKTPSSSKGRLKLLRDGTITPSMHQRKSCIPECTTPLMKARVQLHVSYVPQSLPCREKEYLDIYNFLRGKLGDGCGGYELGPLKLE